MLFRLQGFEFCDQRWLPKAIREGFMDCLNAIHTIWQPYRHLAPVVSRFAQELGAEEVLDLGSGGGEQVATILEYMERQGLPAPRFVLSDLYPDCSAWQRLAERFGTHRVSFFDKPLPCSAIPPTYRALTIFSAFHHLPPEAAKALLAEVVLNRDGILIVEFTRRTLLDFISMLPALVGNLLAVWFMRPSLIKLALSPFIALMVSFDGLISAWRSYTREEILALLPAGKYQVESGEVPWGRMKLLKASFVAVKCQRILQTGPRGGETSAGR